MKRALRLLVMAVMALALTAAPEAYARQPKKAKQTQTTKKKTKSAPAPKTSADARRQRKNAEREMAKTAEQIKATEADLSAKLRKVTKLEEGIETSQRTSEHLKLRIDSLTAASREVGDSIAANEANLARLRELYTRAVRSSRRNRREMNSLTFIFSAETFRQAWRRMRYLEEYSKWRARKTEEISAVVAELEKQKESLEDMKTRVSNLRAEAVKQERRLRADRKELETAVGSLKGRQRELNTMLKRQKSTLDRLDAEIERLILKEAEEARRKAEEEARRKAAAEAAAKAANSDKSDKSDKSAKPAKPTQPSGFAPTPEKPVKASGAFAAQKGKLPSPLSHTYVVAQPFGRQKHRSIKTLEIDNPGIDLETAPDAKARAVYPGKVSAVFVQEGLNHVVLVRHGEYLTVYANIRDLNVKKGQELKTGDVIGTVGASDVNPDRGQLHFEIRREREKFDPRAWLKR